MFFSEHITFNGDILVAVVTVHETGRASSPAVAERPRDVSCLLVISFNIERNLLLLVTSASDLPLRIYS